MSDYDDLRLLIRSQVPILVAETWDENGALQMLTRAAIQESLPLFCWSVVAGLNRLGFGEGVDATQTTEPAEALKRIAAHTEPALFALCDLHPFLDDPRLLRQLKEIALQYNKVGHTLVLLSHCFDIPPEIQRLSAKVAFSLPDEREIMTIVRDEARQWQQQHQGQRVRTDHGTLTQLTRHLRGLTHADARRLIRAAIVQDGTITESDFAELNRAKFELMNLDGVLSFEYRTEQFEQVAGVDRLRAWLQQRREAMFAPTSADRPRGVMLLGVQGAGKSLTARAVAGAWQCPLLRLDMGALYNKFIGETERNLRESLRSATLMAPCVLWIDEIEKGLGNRDSDEGTSQRVLGSLLTWMAEQQAGVFVVATANDISRLPPELLRKGRFDELFFVDLPDDHVRQQIFAIHINKRAHSADAFDLASLSEAADGFSGAEIEQVVVSALYRAAAEQSGLDHMHLLAEIAATVPLSVTMAEPMMALRNWAEGRAVPVH